MKTGQFSVTGKHSFLSFSQGSALTQRTVDFNATFLTELSITQEIQNLASKEKTVCAVNGLSNSL